MQETSENLLLISSRHGQQYQCNLPDIQVTIDKEKTEEKIAIDIGIPELLKPLTDAPCLVKVRLIRLIFLYSLM